MRTVLCPALVAALLIVHPSGDALAQPCPANTPHIDGTWTTLPYLMPINPVSTTLLRTGKVLIVAGSENDKLNGTGNSTYRAAVWDPTGTTGGSVAVQNLTYDIFCSGTAVLPDGRPLIVGGTSSYQFTGENRASFFNPMTDGFAQAQSMQDGRWYGTATALGDGRIMAWSGLDWAGNPNSTVEIYDLRNAGVGWSPPIQGGPTPPLYPRMMLLPDGRVFWNGQGAGAGDGNSWALDPDEGLWTVVTPTTGDRIYGAAVLLPLLPPAYLPRVMNFGGGNDANQAASSTEIIDLDPNAPAHEWVAGPAMTAARMQMNAVLLPNGTVLAEGGSAVSEIPDEPGKHADIYDPSSGTFKSGGTAAYSRLYHSTALLLPDATVASLGSNPGARGSYQPSIEIYTPAYLYDAHDHLITSGRPRITSAPAKVGYGQTLSVSYVSASPIASAVLVRTGSATHAFNMDQRLVGLCGASPQPACRASKGKLSVLTPQNGAVAPPGWYMLFLLDAAGVPSHAEFVQLSRFASAPPTGEIREPAGNVTVRAGESVQFSAVPSAQTHSWIFPGGHPSASLGQGPISVRFTEPGQHVVSMTDVDDSGNSDPNPPTRLVTVMPITSDFDVTVSPEAQIVVGGGTATFRVQVTSHVTFSGPVTLAVNSEGGIPAGITVGGFSPSTIQGSGFSTLTMNTDRSASPYALSLTVTGTSGTIVHAASTTLAVELEPPSGLRAFPGDGRVALVWTGVPAATSYHVMRSTSAGGPYESVACPAARVFTDTGLVNGTTYYYVVSARFTGGPDAGGESAASPGVEVRPEPASTLDVSDAFLDDSAPVELTARLPVAIAGQPVSFSAAGEVCSSITDARGVASCAVTPRAGAGSYVVEATFAGSATLPAGHGSAKLVVDQAHENR